MIVDTPRPGLQFNFSPSASDTCTSAVSNASALSFSDTSPARVPDTSALSDICIILVSDTSTSSVSITCPAATSAEVSDASFLEVSDTSPAADSDVSPIRAADLWRCSISAGFNSLIVEVSDVCPDTSTASWNVISDITGFSDISPAKVTDASPVGVCNACSAAVSVGCPAAVILVSSLQVVDAITLGFLCFDCWSF